MSNMEVIFILIMLNIIQLQMVSQTYQIASFGLISQLLNNTLYKKNGRALDDNEQHVILHGRHLYCDIINSSWVTSLVSQALLLILCNIERLGRAWN